MNNTVAGTVMRRRKGWSEVKGPMGEEESYDWDIFWGDINCFIAETGFQHGKLLESMVSETSSTVVNQRCPFGQSAVGSQCRNRT